MSQTINMVLPSLEKGGVGDAFVQGFQAAMGRDVTTDDFLGCPLMKGRAVVGVCTGYQEIVKNLFPSILTFTIYSRALEADPDLIQWIVEHDKRSIHFKSLQNTAVGAIVVQMDLSFFDEWEFVPSLWPADPIQKSELQLTIGEWPSQIQLTYRNEPCSDMILTKCDSCFVIIVPIRLVHIDQRPYRLHIQSSQPFHYLIDFCVDDGKMFV
jgi:hypothetical protein